jgi:hypothetical protein
MSNYKLAMKYHNEYCPADKLPSGKTLEYMLLYVRQKMFVHLKRAKNSKSNARKKLDKEGNEITLSEEDLPFKWMFNGWFAFVLFVLTGLAQPVCLACLRMDQMSQSKVGLRQEQKRQMLKWRSEGK